MFSSDLVPQKPGRFLELVLSLFMYLFFIVLIAGYVSNTYQTLLAFITKFGDLAGQIVLIDPQYEALCGQYAIYYYLFNYNFYKDFDIALNLLDSSQYQGIIADTTYLKANSYNNSKFVINTHPFITFNYAGIYTRNFPANSVSVINQALSNVQSSAYLSEIMQKYELFYDVNQKTQVVMSVSNCRYLFIIIAICVVLSIGLSMIPFDDFYVSFWNFCLKRRLKYFDELEMTTRTEGPDNMKRNYEVNEKLEASWAHDMSEDSIRLIKASTLTIINYENACLESIDDVINAIRKANNEKLDMITDIEKYIK